MRWIRAVVVGAALGVGFGGFGGAGCSSGTPTPSTSADGSSAPQQVSAVIGAQGGSVTTPSGAGVDIPAGALPANVTVTVLQTPNATPPSGGRAVGSPYTFGPEGQQFTLPVTVTLDFDPTLLPPGKSASDVLIYTAPAGTTNYVPLVTSPVDSTHAAAQTTHFSVLVCFVPSAPPIVPPSDAGAPDTSVPEDATAPVDATVDATAPEDATTLPDATTGVDSGVPDDAQSVEDAAPPPGDASESFDSSTPTCNPATAWPTMLASALVPPNQYAGVDWNGGETDIGAAEAIDCNGAPATAVYSGDTAITWGSEQDVFVEYATTSGLPVEIAFLANYTGSMTFFSRTGGSFGNHTYVVGLHTLTRDSAAFTIAWTDPGPQIAELMDGFLATFDSTAAAVTQCTSATSCKFNLNDGSGHASFAFAGTPPVDFYFSMAAGTSDIAGMSTYFQSVTGSSDAGAGSPDASSPTDASPPPTDASPPPVDAGGPPDAGGTCTPLTVSQCPAGYCGTINNACSSVQCPCDGGSFGSDAGEVCIPATCQTGQCGTINNGCGAPLSCPACGADAGVCSPIIQGQACGALCGGSAPNGCGGSYACPSCGGEDAGTASSLITLASGQNDPEAIAANGTTVYWLNEGTNANGYTDGTLMSAPLDGGALTTLVSGLNNPYGSIAVTGTNVYWANAAYCETIGDDGGTTCLGTLMSEPLGGGAPATLVSGLNNPLGVAVDGTSIYWVDYDATGTTNVVMKAPLGGGAPTTLASGQAAAGPIAADATSVYWTTPGTSANNYTDGVLMKVPVGGGASTTLVSGQDSPRAIAVDATSVYWGNCGTLANNYTDGTVMKLPVAGGAPTTLAWGQGCPVGITVDSTSAYWVDELGTVMSVALGGGTPTLLASGQNNSPFAIAVDGTSVYWANLGTGADGTGSVMKHPGKAGCAPIAQATACAAQCGTVSNGCNGTYSCGACGGGGDAGPACVPFTLASCPSGYCGMLSNVCSSVQCLCDSGPPEDAGSTCPPLTVASCPPDHCGKISNTCGAELQCPCDAGGGSDAGTTTTPPVTLASGQTTPYSVAVDSTSVYWTDNGSGGSGAVMKAPVGGGTPVTLASALSDAALIAVDSTNVYWTEPGAVMSVPLAGGASVPLVSGAGVANPHAIVVDATNAYWTDLLLGTVMKTSLSGGDTSTLASGQQSAEGIAVDGTSVYWTAEGVGSGLGTVMKVPLGGGTPTTLASGLSQPLGIAIDGTSVYWEDENGGNGTVLKVPLGGGAPTTLAVNQGEPEFIAVDATNVYWSNYSGGAVVTVPLGGGTPTTLASGQGSPGGVAVDATSLYWADETGGTVMKLTPKNTCITEIQACGPQCAISVSNGCGGSYECPACVAGTPMPLASGRNGPQYLTMNATNVYWADTGTTDTDGTVLAVPIAGGAVVTLASGQDNPIAVAVDGTNVYWTNAGTTAGGFTNGTVMKVPLAGGTPTPIASGLTQPSLLVVDAQSAYWTENSLGAVMKVPLTGGPPTPLASGQAGPADLAVDSTSVYWTNEGTSASPSGGALMKVALGGGTPATLASGDAAGIAIDATNVYWATTTAVMSVPLGGGTLTTLASGGAPGLIAVDATMVYWTDQTNGVVMSVPIGGGTPTTLASGQSTPVGIAVDATSVYWVDNAGGAADEGSVEKLAKPTSGSGGGDAGTDSGAGTDAGSPDSGGGPPLPLTVMNFEGWCDVTINGGAASATPVISTSVPAGVVTLVAKPATGSPFVIGPDPWFGTSQNDGGAAPGVDNGSGSTETSTATIVHTGSQCVSVCCGEPPSGAGCPATNPCSVP